jgi:phage baseplate assembly protein W
MAEGKTYGIVFPFRDSVEGKYLELSNYTNDELRSNLIHLLLTKKGTRYYLPDFGTRLYEYIFEPLDGPTFGSIESDIREAVEKFIPQLQIKKITVTAASSEEDQSFVTTAGNVINRNVGQPVKQTYEYTAKVRIDYVDTSSAFGTADFVILNI